MSISVIGKTREEIEAYFDGYLACLYDFAHWQSGIMYVGCGVSKYSEVKKEVEERRQQKIREWHQLNKEEKNG